MARLILTINLSNGAITQYHSYGYSSFFKLGSDTYGCNSSGVYELGKSSDDNGVPIVAFAEIVDNDFGIHNNKHLRYITVGAKASGNFSITASMDVDPDPETFILSTPKTDRQSKIRKQCEHYHTGRYFNLIIRNISGSQFSVYSGQLTFIARNINLT